MNNMFLNYENLSDSYIPNNLSSHKYRPESYTKLSPIDASRPYELYNAKGELEGYFWYYGDTINLDFTIDGEVTLEDGTPTGQYIDASDFLKDKSYTIKVYNFRFNEIYSISGEANTNIIINIDSELSSKLIRGIYYCSLEISGKDFHETLFNAEDCKLLVK